jgi:hypothetical protein
VALADARQSAAAATAIGWLRCEGDEKERLDGIVVSGGRGEEGALGERRDDAEIAGELQSGEE